MVFVLLLLSSINDCLVRVCALTVCLCVCLSGEDDAVIMVAAGWSFAII